MEKYMNQHMSQNLYHLHKRLELAYKWYKNGIISEEEYLAFIKPIDQAIDGLEMSTLLDSPVLRGSSSLLSHMPES